RTPQPPRKLTPNSAAFTRTGQPAAPKSHHFPHLHRARAHFTTHRCRTSTTLSTSSSSVSSKRRLRAMPALAGSRSLGLDDPSADRPVLHCNFGGALGVVFGDIGTSPSTIQTAVNT